MHRHQFLAFLPAQRFIPAHATAYPAMPYQLTKPPAPVCPCSHEVWLSSRAARHTAVLWHNVQRGSESGRGLLHVSQPKVQCCISGQLGV